MNRNTWTATPLLAGVLFLSMSAPPAPASAADDPAAGAGASGGQCFPDDAAVAAEWTAAADEEQEPKMSPEAKLLGHLDHIEAPAGGWFTPRPTQYDGPYDAEAQLYVYDQRKGDSGPGKHMNPTANPPVELGRRLYDRGAYKPRPTWLGAKNPIGFHFMSYGDLRIAGAYYDNGTVSSSGETEQSVIAARLNMDMDVAFTATERIHAFVRPLDKNGSFTRYQISGGAEDNEFVDEFDFHLDTLFFEGDLGAMSQGWSNRINQLDLPIAIGRVPLFTQNGIWLQDTFDGFAIGITAKNSPKLDVSNYDVTFFAGFNEVSTAAVANSADKAKVFGIATFADAHKGYFEAGYGYLDADDSDFSYHNLTAAFSRRYAGRVANTVRVIGNFGQSAATKTADGVLVLVENSLVPRRPWNAFPSPANVVPYLNLFAGFDSPQSLARAGDAGGVLNNTGINFESDGLTGYPTLDGRAQDSYGGALGLEYLFELDRQIVVEAAVVERMNDNPLGRQYALGARYQHPINNRWIVRLDAMHGWRQGLDDVFGARLEIRRKL